LKRSRRRRFGQNFLVDRTVARRIVELLDPENPRVLEIGPGRGALTGPLLDRFRSVRALELDQALVAPLRKRFEDRGLEVVHADALTVPLGTFVDDSGAWQVASNLPYSVGTAILRRLMPRHEIFTRLVVMLQREVADRLVALPGDRQHGLMALERAAWADARLAFSVPPKAFRPVPKVASAVLVVDLRPPAFDARDLGGALELAGRALTRPRKMLANAIGGETTVEHIEASGLDPRMRPGELELRDWVCLASRFGGRRKSDR
jgi:16S rRNA (adenine1518-N6/adenine1519-N6)-dimethyltransferase